MKSTKKKKINKYDNGSYCAFLTHSTKKKKNTGSVLSSQFFSLDCLVVLCV